MYRKDLRPEIVDSFIAEFNEFGPKLTLDRVSSRIHISKKTIYRFFRSKDEIYSYILKQAARDVAMGQKAVLEDSSLSPAEKVRRILTVETLWESKIDISKVAELTEEAPGIAKEILEAYHASWGAVRQALNDAKEKGVVRPEERRGETLGVLDDGHGMAEVVQRLHGVHVQLHAQLAEVLGEFGIHAAALVGRHVKMREAVDPLRVQSLCERRAMLFEVQVINLPSRLFHRGVASRRAPARGESPIME